MRTNFRKAKSSFLTVLSGIAFIFLIWMLIFGKVKASALLAPFLKKLPKNETELVSGTEGVLGEAVEKIKEGNLKKIIEKGSTLFESSQLAEPARDIRENVKQKIDETLQSAKELPAKEIKIIQMEICKQWLLDEISATSSGSEEKE